MRSLKTVNRFKKNLKLQHKRGKSIHKLEDITVFILENGDAPEHCRPHDLVGNWVGYRECHIEPDWLLVYTVTDELVTLYRTGTHADIFG